MISSRQQYQNKSYIDLNLLILSSIGGCVAQIEPFDDVDLLKGLAM